MEKDVLDGLIQPNIKSNVHKEMSKVIKMNETLAVNNLPSQTKAPALIIGFSDDRNSLAENTCKIASLISGATYLEINSGHASQ